MDQQEAKRESDERFDRQALAENLKSRLAFKKSWIDKFADFMTWASGTITFLLLNCAVFAIWILWNEGTLGLTPFDPFPYSLLTMAVSLEAIILSIIVLVSQNRQGHIADIREKLDFEIDVRSEQEITKILIMLDELQKHSGMRGHLKDNELMEMKKRVNLVELQKEAEGE